MFNNFGRQIVDNSVCAMASGVLGKKKKDLERIMNKEGSNTPSYLMGVAGRAGRILAFEKNKNGFAVAFDYKKATHYYVSNLPSVVAITGIPDGNKIKCLEIFDDKFTIESSLKDMTVFASFHNMRKDSPDKEGILLEGKKTIWCFNVFLNSTLTNLCPVHYPVFTGYITENWEDIYFVANEFHPITKAFKTRTIPYKFDDYDPYDVRVIIPTDKASKLVPVVCEHLFDCITYIYAEITGSKRKKTKEEAAAEFIVDYLNNAIKDLSGEHSESINVKPRAISVAHETKIEVEVEDKLVSLQSYLKEYNPSTRQQYKGGHHASPVPHERKGFYRRSRGRGDYALVDNEFIFMPDKTGTYSWVSATHVGGKESNKKPTTIYKV